MAGGPRTRQVRTLTDHLKFHLKMAPFIWTTKCRYGVWNSGKSSLDNKQTSSAFSPWVAGISPGAQALRHPLELGVGLLRLTGGAACGLLESGRVPTSVPGTKLLQALITKLTSYYLT